MKILVLTNLYPNCREPARGIFVRQQVRELLGWCEIKVIAPLPWVPALGRFRAKIAAGSAVPFREETEGIEVFHPRWFVIPKILRSLYGFLYAVGVLQQLLRVRRQFDFDAIDAQWAYPDGFAAVLLGKLVKRPVIVHALGCDINLYTRYFFRRKMIAWSLKNAAGVIAVSEALKARMIEIGVPANRITVMANGIDTALFVPKDRDACRNDLGLAPRGKIALFTGRLEEEKGIRYLLEAMRMLRSGPVGKDLRLVIVGDGTLRQELLRRATTLGIVDRIIFAGARPHHEIPRWMGSCDVFCLPSLREGMPNVVLEALACGRPVVATRVGAVPDIICSDDYGFLAEPQDAPELAAALEKALSASWEPQVIAERGAARSWKQVAGDLAAEFSRHLESQRERRLQETRAL